MALMTSYLRKDHTNSSRAQHQIVYEDKPTIASRVKFFAENKGSQDAVVFASPDRVYPRETVPFQQLYQRATTVARALVNLGIKPGEVVAVNIRPCPEWLYMAFGAILAGAVLLGVSFTYSDGSDLVALIDKLKTCALLTLDTGTDGTNWKILEKLLNDYNEDGKVKSNKIPYLRYVISHAFPDDTCPRIRSVTQLLETDLGHVELPSCNVDDTVILFQTSGSTGVPKLVAHSNKTLLGGLDDKNMLDNIIFNDRPFPWSGGFPRQIFLGQTRVTVSGYGQHSSYDLRRMIEVITEEKCKHMFTIPPQLTELIKVQDHLPAEWPIENIFVGGQPVTKHLVQAIGKVCNSLSIAYGCTESNMVSTNRITEAERFHDYNCGFLPDLNDLEVKIVDDEGHIVPINTRGEIYIKSPTVFKRYHNDPEKTEKAIDSDGWFRSDDIGKMTETGELFVYGRKSNMIVSGGMKVSPDILEKVLRRYPGVDNVVIVPVSDPAFYQVLCACVVVDDDHVVTEADLKTHCENFHNDKPGLFTVLPKFYLFFKEFPKTYIGKTGRALMQHMAEQKFGGK